MGLFKSTAVVSSMTMVSRVFGLLRDMVFTRIFGADAGTDAFLVAFKIPNFLRRLFAEGAFSQAFVPVLSGVKTEQGDEAVSDLVRHTLGTMAGILFFMTVFAAIAAPILVMIFAPGFIDQPEKFALTTDMLRITFPYIMFMSLTALSAGILNSYGRFAVPAFTPVLLNLSLIGAAIWLAPMMEVPIMALAWGVFFAGTAQLAFQIPFILKLGLLRWPRWGWRHSGVRKILKLMLPGIFGSSVMQINLLFDTLIASFLVSGSVTWLYLSDRMVELPLGIFGIALATVILPNLSKKHAAGDPRAFSLMLDWALRWVLVIALPAAVALAVLAGPILSTLFLYGDFRALDVEMAAISLLVYSGGLIGFILVKVLAPGYFSRQDTKTPVKVGLIAMVANMVMNVLFVVPMVQLGWSAPHAGLALATSISSFINAALLYRGLKRAGVYSPSTGWMKLFLQTGFAVIVMGVLIYLAAGELSFWITATASQRIFQLSWIIPLGALSYFAVLRLSGVRFSQLQRPRQS
ncbi:MAG: murein biosynthesis integral membrane protein MurJ [Gammaproteobacteria bacterium]|nr:murein biosynthesis integral membrane protein MurJ [Gammaproteobacteria bacterium]